MCALEAFFNPELLQGDTVDEEWNVIRKEDVRKCLDDWYDVIQFLEDWENRLFVLLYQDYDRLPAVIVDFRKMYRLWKTAYAVQGKHSPNGAD